MAYHLVTSRPGWRTAAMIGILAGLSAFFAVAPVARATLQLTAQSVTVNTGDVNDAFDVYLTNIGAAPVDVASFSFEITTSFSEVTFEDATTATSLFPYIFAGNSLFGPVISTASGQTLDASDVVAVPNSFTVVNPGASLGLGKVFFDVGRRVRPPQVAPVDFNTSAAFTSVSDQLGNLLPINFTNGQITIEAAAVVPEPSTWAMILIGFAGLGYTSYRTSRSRSYSAIRHCRILSKTQSRLVEDSDRLSRRSG